MRRPADALRERGLTRFAKHRTTDQTQVIRTGGEPFVLLFDPITFGTPAGKKEIDVLVNH